MNRLPAKTKGPIRKHASDQASVNGQVDLKPDQSGKPFGSPKG